jgi:hypothetical protein
MNRKLEIVSDTLISIAKLLFIYYIISLFGIIRAFAITYLYYKLTEFLLKKYFNLEKVESKDRLFLGKEIWERYNVVIILKMKDFSEDKMKDFLIERVIKKFPKFSKVLVEKFNNYFWKKVPLENAISKIRKIQTKFIKDQQDFLNYINFQVNTPTDIYNDYGYEFHLIKFDDKLKEGALVFKFDHAFSDGLGALSVIACIADNYEYSLFPSIMQKKNHFNFWSFSFIWKLICDFISFPILFYNCFRFVDPNHMLNPKNLNRTGESIISISKCYNFENLFDRCKKLNLSFNEFLIANFSAGLKRYMDSIRDSNYRKKHMKCFTIPKTLVVAIPIGNRGIPKDASEVSLQNVGNLAYVNLPLIDDPIKDYHIIKKSLNKSVGNIVQHFFNKVFTYVTLQILPKFLYEHLKEIFISNLDMCISNVPGSKRTLLYSGSEVYDIIPVVNSGITFIFVLMLTYNNNFRFHIAVDRALGINPQDIIDSLEITLEKAID